MWKPLVVALSLATPMFAQSLRDGVEMTVAINKVTAMKYGFKVAVTVTNVGSIPATLALTGASESKLHMLFVQQWDENLGWQEVGQCHDTVPTATTTLKPGQPFEDVEPIGDLAHGFTSTPCPRRIQHLRGSIRAVVCAFKSEREFKNRMRTAVPCKEFYSPSYNLPEDEVRALGSVP
jgi:hypothetical protein